MPVANVVRKIGQESTPYWFLNGLYDIRVSADETDGALTVMEMTVPEGSGPPPHHHDVAETVYVLDGRARFTIDGDTVEAGPGSVFHFTAGTKEFFEAVGGPVRVLVHYSPGGIDRFFAELGEPATRRELPTPSNTPPDVERLAAAGARYGLHIEPPS